MRGGEDRLPAIRDALDREVKVARLAKLSPIEYDRCREAEAEALGCRVGTLDKEVAKARGEGETDGQGRALEFPEVTPWPEPVDGGPLLDEVTGAIHRYVILPEHGAEACALWAVMTWLADDLDLLPLLRVLSPTRGCGKSTLLDVMSELVHRPMAASGVSSASLFRVIEKHRPTMLMDEVDTYLKQSDEHRQILNAGHTRIAANVIRTVGEDHEPRAFNVFGPKLLAGIGTLPGTIEDRAIRIELRKRAPGEVINSLRRDGRDQFEDLRRKICRWAADHRADIRGRVAHVEMPAKLSDRAADNWSPLVAIAELASPAWAAKARTAAEVLSATDDLDERNVELLADIRDIFVARSVAVLKSADLLADLVALEGRPWAEANHGRPMTAHYLASRLKGFKVSPRDVRPPGEKNAKGYRLDDLIDPFTRYLPAIEPRHRDNPDGEPLSAGIETVTDVSVSRIKNPLKPNGGAVCHGVTDRNAREAQGVLVDPPAPGTVDACCAEWDRDAAEE